MIGREQFEQKIREYSPGMYRLALAMLHNREDAEDAVGEAVLRAYEKIHTLRKEDSFRPWVMQITANEARKIYGKNRQVMPVDDMEAYMPAFREDRHELWDVVQQLDLVYREVVMLYFYERFSIKEIGAILQIPEGTVKSRLSRGKKALRDLMGE